VEDDEMTRTIVTTVVIECGTILVTTASTRCRLYRANQSINHILQQFDNTQFD